MMEYIYISPEEYTIAEENGISKKLVYQRVYSNGWTNEKAITTPVHVPERLWEEWEDKSVVHKTTFYQRMQRGMTPEQAATTKPGSFRRKQKNPIIPEEAFEKASKIGLKRHTVHNRVNQLGWPLEEAITTPPMPKTMKRKKKKGGWY